MNFIRHPLEFFWRKSSEGAAHLTRHVTSGVDYPLLVTVLGLVLFGLIMVYSASFIYAQERTGDGFSFIKKQLLFAFFGFLSMVFFSRFPYRQLSRWSNWIFGFAIGALALVLIPGVGAKVGGAQRWIRFGFLNFQPAEFAKLASIIFVSSQLSKLKQVQPAQLLAVIPMFLLLLAQPDFGTSVVAIVVIGILMFLGGISLRIFSGSVAITAMLAAVLVFSTPYRRERLLSYLDPWRDPMGKGFQMIQSLLGLHHGRIWGVGLGNGKEKLFYLPEAHNDFIFAVIGEELGFFGLVAVAFCFLLICYRGFKIAWASLKAHTEIEGSDSGGNPFGFYLASGITSLLVFQSFINMMVALGLVPTKGLTLPFISYGGSALFINLTMIGILLSISRDQLYVEK